MSEPKPNILILLPWEEKIRFTFEKLILARFPNLPVTTVATLKEAAEKIIDAEIFMAFGVAVKEDIFGTAKKLRWVHAFGTGVDGIIDRPGLAPHVLVTSTRGIHGAPLSEIAILHMLALARDYPRSIRAHDKHQWDRFRARLLQGKRGRRAGDIFLPSSMGLYKFCQALGILFYRRVCSKLLQL